MMVLGNLGWYQLLVVFAKHVGGPKRLILLLMTAGAVIAKGGEKLYEVATDKLEEVF